MILFCRSSADIKGQEANFYIQTKGLHAGRPLKNAIPNCVAVETDVENAFEIVYALWVAKKFVPYIGGSVVPFIRIADLKKVVLNGFEAVTDNKLTSKIEKIDSAIENMEKQLELLKQMRFSLANHLFK